MSKANSQKSIVSRQAGFTFIELLVYIAILTIMLLGMGGIVENIMMGGERANVIKEVSSNARFALNKITQVAREAESINSPLPGATDATLSLQMTNPKKNPTIFSITDSTLTIKEGAEGEVTNITSRWIKVTDLQFINVSYPATPGTIFVSFTLSYTPAEVPTYEIERSFQTTINLLPK